jgi:uncharacterized protein
MRKIVLAGGSGQVGRLLAKHFQETGDSVVVLSRSPQNATWRTMIWDGVTLGPWCAELDGADVVINLAGRSVNCRYTAVNRREILDSRVNSTRILGAALQGLNDPPKVWLNASTATIYRHAFDRSMDDWTGEIDTVQPGAPPEWNFSIEAATAWEQAFFESENPGVRKVALRSAMVMSESRGGVFDVLLRLVRFGLGGAAGSGKQFMSWIHAEDFVRAIEFLIAQDELNGPVNLASPNPVPNAEFMRVVREAWGIPFGLPAREWMLEVGAVALRTETELLLKSRRVVPGKLTDAGFGFRFPEWKEAAKELVRMWRMNRSDMRQVGEEEAGMKASAT